MQTREGGLLLGRSSALRIPGTEQLLLTVVITDIFSFETGDYRGFEESGLSHDWQNVVLHLFDRGDRHWFTILIAAEPALV